MSTDFAYETSGPQWVDLQEITNDNISNDDFFDRTHDSLEASPVKPKSQLRKSTRLQNKVSSNVKTSEVNDIDKSEIQSALIDDIDNIYLTPLKLKSPKINNKDVCLQEYDVNDILNDAMEGLKLASSIKKRSKHQNIDKSIYPKIEIIPDTPTREKTPLKKSLHEVTLNTQNQMSNNQTPAKKIINVRRSARNPTNDMTANNMTIQDKKLTKNSETEKKINETNKTDINLENKMAEELDNIKENIQIDNIITKNKNSRVSDCYSSIKNADTNLVKKKLRICRSMHQNTPVNRTPVFNLKTSPCTMNLKQSKIPVFKLDCSDDRIQNKLIDEKICLENNELVPKQLQNNDFNDKPENKNLVESKGDDYNKEKLPNINDVEEEQQINIPDIESQADDHDYIDTEFQPFDEFSKSLDEDENRYKVFKSQYTQKTLRNIKKTAILAGQARRNSIQMKNILNRQRSNKYISLAEGVKAFQRSTPTRFHTVSKNTEGIKKSKVNQKTTQQAFKRTIPVSPNWHSKMRTRKVVQEQEQGQEKKTVTNKVTVQKAPITTSKGSKAQKEIVKKRITVPKPFNLSEPKKKIEPSQQPQVNVSKFNKIASQKTNSQKVEILHSSILMSRDFNTSSKLEPKKMKTLPVLFQFEQRNKKVLVEKENKIKKLQDEKMKINEKTSISIKNDKDSKDSKNKKENGVKSNSHIKVVPFSFEERDRLLAKKKEEMRKKIEEEEKKARVFHANPVPNFKPIQIKVPSRENLNCNKNLLRTKSAETIKSKDNVKESKVVRALSNDHFKYSKRQLSNEIISAQKTQPTGSSSLNIGEHNKAIDMPKLKPKLKPLNIELHSERRARLRREYEQRVKARLDQEEARRHREQEIKLAKEQEEIVKLRKQAEHKARPVPVYKPLVIAKSMKPITEPQSPAWTQSRR